MSLRALLVFTATAGFVAAAGAADWPQWRGPNRDGKSAEKGIDKAWPAGGPKLLWKIDTAGAGYGSVAVVGDKVYVLGGESAKEVKPEFLLCLGAADGKEVWRTVLNPNPTGPGGLGRTFSQYGGGPRSVPTVDGDFVYAFGATGDVVCVARAGGKLVWHKNLVKDFGGGVTNWGYSESPLVDGDKVVCTPGGKGGMVALDKKTGATVWQCKELSDPAGYSSVVVTEVGGARQYVQQTNASGVGVRAADGKLLWRVNELSRRTAVIPTPVVKDNHVFFTAGYGAGCELVKLEPDGADRTKATKVYTKNSVISNHHGGVIEVGGLLYGFSDSKQWFCYDFLKGGDDLVWTSNKLGKGSITYADGHFVCYGEAKGTVVLIKASKTGWEEAGRFDLPVKSALRPGSGKFWPHPVVANGKLFLRDTEFLLCYDIGGPGA